MKIGILHQDLEEDEILFQSSFERLGCEVELFDVRTSSAAGLTHLDLLFNRVYASVANREYRDNLNALEVLRSLERAGVSCINSSSATEADYSKCKAFDLMKARDVRTPETLLVEAPLDRDSIQRFVEAHGFPLILKRDLGGRSEGVVKADSFEFLNKALAGLQRRGSLNNGSSGFILQEFIASVRSYDTRITVFDGEVLFTHGRSLMAVDGQVPWLAGLSTGGEMIECKPNHEEIELALKASAAIGAVLNEVDCVMSAIGPMIIENNPTPNYPKQVVDKRRRILRISERVCRRAAYRTADSR